MSERFHLFYIHGFNSSPRSVKAQQIRDALKHYPQIVFLVPQLPFHPQKALQIVYKAIQQCLPEPVGLVGSSMGGYLGLNAAEKFDLPLVLVNPAIRPYELMQDYLGEVVNDYTGERFDLTREHTSMLKDMEVTKITRPERYLLMTQTADEVLDYRQGVDKFAESKQIVEEGGDHSFQNFHLHIPQILDFFGIQPNTIQNK